MRKAIHRQLISNRRGGAAIDYTDIDVGQAEMSQLINLKGEDLAQFVKDKREMMTNKAVSNIVNRLQTLKALKAAQETESHTSE